MNRVIGQTASDKYLAQSISSGFLEESFPLLWLVKEAHEEDHADRRLSHVRILFIPVQARAADTPTDPS